MCYARTLILLKVDHADAFTFVFLPTSGFPPASVLALAVSPLSASVSTLPLLISRWFLASRLRPRLPSSRLRCDHGRPCRNTKMYLADLTLGQHGTSTTCARNFNRESRRDSTNTSTCQPSQSSSQESGNNDGRIPAQPNTATSASDPLTESHGPSPFNQSHHVPSRTSFPDGLSSVIHLIRGPTTRPSHLRMCPSTAGNTGSADFPTPFPSCLKCFFHFFFLFSPPLQSQSSIS